MQLVQQKVRVAWQDAVRRRVTDCVLDKAGAEYEERKSNGPTMYKARKAAPRISTCEPKDAEIAGERPN